MLNNFKLTRSLAILSFFAVILAYVVIGLGAYTRLSNAGLGCPDWPGCYGRLTVPTNQKTIQKIDSRYSATPLIAHKARAEMIHRYIAGTLGLLILGITFLSALISINRGFPFLIIALLLFSLVIYQILLGMWTVTLKLLPIIVTQHLLGGMLLLSFLWLIHLRTRQLNIAIHPTESEKKLKIIAMTVLIAVFLQVFLGAWTSTNYAAIVCHGFPFCHPSVPLTYDFRSAFNLFSPIGVNYDGGILNNAARMTIQMTHRFGALIVSILILVLFFKTKNNRLLRKIMKFGLIILMIQIALGVCNVLFSRPLIISMLHNLLGATLLLSVITANHFLYEKKSVEK